MLNKQPNSELIFVAFSCIKVMDITDIVMEGTVNLAWLFKDELYSFENSDHLLDFTY